MAKCRFPGKALKLKSRKKVKFRQLDTNNEDLLYSRRIAQGFEIFKNLFGSSEEDDDFDFEGFNADDTGLSARYLKTLKASGIKSASVSISNGITSKNSDCNVVKRKVGRPLKVYKNISSVESSSTGNDITRDENINEVHANLHNDIARPARVGRPPKRLIENDNSSQTGNQSPDGQHSLKRRAGRPRKGLSLSGLGFPSEHIPSPQMTEDDEMCRTISLYADAISSDPTQEIRTTRSSQLLNGETAVVIDAPIASAKVQEKIEKLLKSPWDGRIKQTNTKAEVSESNPISRPSSNTQTASVIASKNVLRKARLHLNKRVLQKIRNPVSVQHFLNQHEDVGGIGACGVCSVRSKCDHQYGASLCQHCITFLSTLSDKPSTEELSCHRDYGGCQIVGMSISDRCASCWLSQALLSCTMPSLLHDRLRKKLPQHLKEKVPTSLARSVYITEMNSSSGGGSSGRIGECTRLNKLPQTSVGLSGDRSVVGGLFGSIVDLPGGWKRKTGPEVVVISPSGEKFKSLPKLEEYLLKLGVNTDARVLFGSTSTTSSKAVNDLNVGGNDQECKENMNVHPTTKTKRRKTKKLTSPLKNNSNCVVTTLPGGWTRRTKFKPGLKLARFDVYVTSPDGQTFRSRKQLSAYFSKIGKVDDILKYFPLFNDCGEQVSSSSEVTESSTEPGSGKDTFSDEDEDGVLSDVGEEHVNRLEEEEDMLPFDNEDDAGVLSDDISDDDCDNILAGKRNNKLNLSNEGTSQAADFIGFDLPFGNVQNISSTKSCVNSDHVSSSPAKRESISIEIPALSHLKQSAKASESSSETYSESPNLLSDEPSAKRHKKKKKHKNKDKKKKKDKQRKTHSFCSSPEKSETVKEKSETIKEKSETIKEKRENVPSEQSQRVARNEHATRNNVSEASTLNDSQTVRIKPLLTKSIRSNNKTFQTQHLEGGWSRKIKWNPDGTGSVSFIVTPSGSKIKSVMELQAYLKKDSAPVSDASYYFSQILTRKDVPLKPVTPKSGNTRTKQDTAADKATSRKDDTNVGTSNNGLPVDTGPRIKRVCRSFEQAVGMPRATFPAKEDKENKEDLQHSKKTVEREEESSDAASNHSYGSSVSNGQRQQKTSKVYSVRTTAKGKVLRKMQWCNRCSGCLIPNCRKCVNCLDMVKYGGPGSKKKPCVMRQCMKPSLTVRTVGGKEATSKPDNKKMKTGIKKPILTAGKKPVPIASKKPVPIAGKKPVPITAGKKPVPIAAGKKPRKFMLEGNSDDEDEDDSRGACSVFVPRQHVPAPLQDVKQQERCQDSDGQKKAVVPGAMVDIDYWQSYEQEQVMLQGFSILQAAPLHLTALCFRCGSAGQEEMLWCSYCCEGVHVFCLEEGEGPQTDKEVWVCGRCAVCHVCGTSGTLTAAPLLRCSSCLHYYHLECLGPGAHESCNPPNDALWRCVGCSRCSSCNAASITTWICIPPAQVRLPLSPAKLSDIPTSLSTATLAEGGSVLSQRGNANVSSSGRSEEQMLGLCSRCVDLRAKENYCPLCQGCYEDDDYDARMMECGRCKEWIHAQCEGLSNEHYQILSCLPDSVEYVCRLCLGPNSDSYLNPIMGELKAGMELVLKHLMASKCAKHLNKRDYRSSIYKNRRPSSVSSNGSKKSLPESLSSVRVSTRALCSDKLQCHGDSLSSNLRDNDSLNTDSKCKVPPTMTTVVPAEAVPEGVKIADTEAHVCKGVYPPNNTTSDSLSKEIEKPNAEVSETNHTSDENVINIALPKQTNSAQSKKSIRSCSVQLRDICKKSSDPGGNTTVAQSSKILEPIPEVDGGSESETGMEDIQADINKIVHRLEDNVNKNSEKLTDDVFLPALQNSNNKPAASSTQTSKEMKASRVDPKLRITKDIDDDLVSTEESSFCDTDSELESLIEDPDEPKDFISIQERLRDHKYDTVLQFHVDVCRVVEAGKFLSKGQTRSVLNTYAKQMKECFPWFDVQGVNIFDLIDKYHPFPVPHSDHVYAAVNPQCKQSSGTDAKLLHSVNVTQRSICSLSPVKPATPINTPDPILRATGVRKCVLCSSVGDCPPEQEGRLLYLGQDEWIHINCGLWSSEVFEEDDGGLQKVYEAASRGRMIKCNACNDRGATIGCCHRNCSATFHFKCAIKTMCQFLQDKRMFCSLHKYEGEEVDEIGSFFVNRRVFVDMNSQKKKWKRVLGSKVNVTIGSLTIHSLGRILPELDSCEALIPVDFVCSRLYWSTVDPRKKVRYVCRTKRVVADACAALSARETAANHFVIDHSKDSATVEKELQQMRDWYKKLNDEKVAQVSRETNIIPPHLCPLYKEIMLRDINRRHKSKPIQSCLSLTDVTGNSEEIVKQVLDEVIDKVCRNIDEENLLLDPDLPGIVSSVDNELISMVLNDLDECDGLMQSSPASPLEELDFLNNLHEVIPYNCVQQMNANTQISECMDVHKAEEACPNDDLTPPNSVHVQETSSSINQDNIIVALDSNCESVPKQLPNITEWNTESEMHLSDAAPLDLTEEQTPVDDKEKEEPTSTLSSVKDGSLNCDDSACTSSCAEATLKTCNEFVHTEGCVTSSPDPCLVSSHLSEPQCSNTPCSVPKESSVNVTPTAGSEAQVSTSESLNTTDASPVFCLTASASSVEPTVSDLLGDCVKEAVDSTPSTQTAQESNIAAVEMTASEAANTTGSDNNKGEVKSTNSSSNLFSSTSSSSVKKKKVCRVLPMVSQTWPSSNELNSASSSSSRSVQQGADEKKPSVLELPNDAAKSNSKPNASKKICMKRNYKTVIKKYPLRSNMKKSKKPYQTVQIEINETIEIPEEEDDIRRSVLRNSVKRKWNTVVQEDDIDGNCSKRRRTRSCSTRSAKSCSSDTSCESQEDNKTSNVSKKVVKFSDDGNDITVSIVNNNNLCDFSKSRVHKYRHKTLLQVDGAVDMSSCSDCSESENESKNGSATNAPSLTTSPNATSFKCPAKEQHPPGSAVHAPQAEELSTEAAKSKPGCSSLAIRIKEQSLAHSSPGDEGPYKCFKCRRLYRTRESYERHTESCTFEIDSSSTSDEEMEDAAAQMAAKNAAAALTDSTCSTVVKVEQVQPPTEYQQTSSSVKIKTDVLPPQPPIVSTVQDSSVPVALKQSPPPRSPEKFIGVKKSCNQRRYSNMKLAKVSRGYQAKQDVIAPAVVVSDQNVTTFNVGPTPVFDFRGPQQLAVGGSPRNTPQPIQINIPAAFPSCPTGSAIPIDSSGMMAAATSGSYSTEGLQMASNLTALSVVPGTSSASTMAPSNFTLQYTYNNESQQPQAIIHGYQGLLQQQPNILQQQIMHHHQIVQPTAVLPTNLMPQIQHQVQPLQIPQQMVQGSIMVPQVVNTNITYAISNNPKTLVINQPTIIPSVQMLQQSTSGTLPTVLPHSYHQDVTSTPVSLHHQQMLPVSIIDSNSFHSQSHFVRATPDVCQNLQQKVQTPLQIPLRQLPSVPVSENIQRVSYAPQTNSMKVVTSTTSAATVTAASKNNNSVTRSVARIEPAIISTSASHHETKSVPINIESISSAGEQQGVVSSQTAKIPTCGGESEKPPRPSYSYRDAMKPQVPQKKIIQDMLLKQQIKQQQQQQKEFNAPEPMNQEESVTDENKAPTDSEEQGLVTQSYKLVLNRDNNEACGFNILPIEGRNIQLVDHEVKELRIKAKVSLGPKRKRTNLPLAPVPPPPSVANNDIMMCPNDLTNDGLVNEQTANMAPPNQAQANLTDDPNLFDKPKANSTGSAEPYIVFELTSSDGFKVESRHMSEVWQTVYDAVSAARASLRLQQGVADMRAASVGGGRSMSGLHMLGLTHNAVQYLLEQLPGSNDCQRYSFQFHRRHREEGSDEGSPSGCARTEAFKSRSPYDLFSWLASQHRRLPETDVLTVQEEIQLSTRRATSMELPMAMRYRHLKDTAREAVGVFRSSIHGRGLFCKRDIDAGEMVIEYAGQMIRASLCDIREKYYESKGIGCYMFRIDDDTVVDATMHGNAARFINHSCDPNCYSRIVDILGKKHIIIFALRRIIRGEELTYDYKFPIEDDKIPCSCGAKRCRKTLN